MERCALLPMKFQSRRFFVAETEAPPTSRFVLKQYLNRISNTLLEVKLTVLPTDQTCRQPKDKRGCELVIRSATTSYCALGMFDSVKGHARHIRELFEEACSSIQMWDNNFELTHKTPLLCQSIDRFQQEYYANQKPLLTQTVWKTQGKSPLLADQAFDIVIMERLCFFKTVY